MVYGVVFAHGTITSDHMVSGVIQRVCINFLISFMFAALSKYNFVTTCCFE
jgi:hypothetical protein